MAIIDPKEIRPFDGTVGIPEWVATWASKVGKKQGSHICSGQWMAWREYDNGPVSFWLQIGETKR